MFLTDWQKVNGRSHKRPMLLSESIAAARYNNQNMAKRIANVG